MNPRRRTALLTLAKCESKSHQIAAADGEEKKY